MPQPRRLLRRVATHLRWPIAIIISLLLHLVALIWLGGIVMLDRTIDPSSSRPFDILIEPAVASASSAPHPPTARPAQTPPPSPLSIASAYFPARELDIIPQIRREIDIFPAELRASHPAEGKLVLMLWLAETGLVSRAEILESSLPDAYTDSATAAFRQTEFHPGQKSGNAVKSRIKIVLHYPTKPPAP